MKWRTLIGMLVGGRELRDYTEALAEMVVFAHRLRERDALDGARHNRDMIANFLSALDHPEVHDELRETLHEALRDLSDEVARVEEHVS